MKENFLPDMVLDGMPSIIRPGLRQKKKRGKRKEKETEVCLIAPLPFLWLP